MKEKEEGQMKKYDVIALGELLIDFIQNGISEQGNLLFEANPGGAPCNLLSMLAKLGHKTAFIGKVGKDSFGKKLQEVLAQVGIDTAYLARDEEVPTTLALVHTLPDGDRDFSFYRNPGADMRLTKKEIPKECNQCEYSKLCRGGAKCLSYALHKNYLMKGMCFCTSFSF